MKIKMIFNSKIPKVCGADAITLYPFIFFKLSKDEALAQKEINHEWIHVTQVRKHGWLTFYCAYFIDFLVAAWKLKSKEKAYEAIPYEQEAYAGQNTYTLPPEAIEAMNR